MGASPQLLLANLSEHVLVQRLSVAAAVLAVERNPRLVSQPKLTVSLILALVLSLTDRVVILTGASSGLGAQLARALDCAGAIVVLAARRVDRINALADELPNATAVQCDVTDEDARERLVAFALDRWGRLDGLVNNAGVSNVARALTETTDDFNRIMQTNLVAPFGLSQIVARAMRERGGGSIVNVASVSAYRAIPQLPAAAYAASKAGLVGLTRELAVQWGRHRIRVNAVAPGFFETEMTAGLFAEGGAGPEWLMKVVPLGRSGEAGELDSAVVFLLSEASSYLTGHTIVVDGGMTA